MVRLKKVPPRASPSPRGKKQDSSWWIKWMVTLGGVVAFVMMTLHVSRSNDLKPILELLNPTDTEIMEIKNDVRVDKIKQGKIKQAQDLVAANQQAIAARQHQQQPQLPIILDRSDLIYRRGTWDKAPVIIEKYKLVFFTMPKVGCTEFKKLFRRMMGFANWRDHQYFDPPYLPHNPDANGLKYLGDFPFEKANEMLTSPEWTRAIFVRDPQQRALSAYLDKAAYSEGYYLRMQCCKRFRPGSIEYNLINCATGTNRYTKPKPGEEHIKPTPILSFEDYVSKIVPKCPDPHWEPQASRMAPKYWETINFVGHFEHLFEDTKTLLTQIDAWEEYGANGWGTGDGQDAAIFDPGNKVTHGTKAQDKSSASQYFTPEAKRHILEYYADDYRHPVLNFTRPPARR